MSDKETFKKELNERTAEIEKLIETYLPEETGHPEDHPGSYELQYKGRRQAPAPHADAGSLPAVWRKRPPGGAFYGCN